MSLGAIVARGSHELAALFSVIRARFERRGRLLLSLAVLPLLAACGSAAKPVSIVITPSMTTLEAGDSLTFRVVAQDTSVLWPDAVVGDFTRDGDTITYTPPASAGTYEFTVTAAADPTKTATAVVEVFVPPPPQITSFSLQGLPVSEIDQDAGTIVFSTTGWIDNLDALKAEFASVGAVTVDGAAQVSGETSHDFHKEVLYTVATGKFAQRTYTVRIESPQTTGLPVVKIDTQNAEEIISKENYVQTNFAVIDPDNPQYEIAHSGYSDQIRGRGNSTWTYPKKPYRVKFNKKTALFGLEAAKSWVLLANYQDPTLLMNSITFELGRRFGMPYSNHSIYVELFLNGEYRGNYLLTEQIQTGKGRVDIDEDRGFLVELDANYDDEPKFRTAIYDLPVMIKTPQDLSDPSGYDFVKNAIAELESAMSAPAFPDNGYRDLLDMRSVVAFLLINEIVKNNELAWPKSTFMYRDADAKISFGPLWDFDWGFSYQGYGFQYFTDIGGSIGKHPFLARFYDDPVFVQAYKARWNEMYEQIAAMPDFIAEWASRLQKSQQQNFRRWPETQNNGYAREISDLTSWWRNRVDFLNQSIAAMP